jgi:cell division protease FtsH
MSEDNAEQQRSTAPGGGGPNNDNNNFNFNFRNNRFALIFLVALLGMFVVMLFSNTQTVGREIPYSQFLGYLREGQVESVRILDQYEIQGQLRTSAGRVLGLRHQHSLL